MPDDLISAVARHRAALDADPPRSLLQAINGINRRAPVLPWHVASAAELAEAARDAAAYHLALAGWCDNHPDLPRQGDLGAIFDLIGSLPDEEPGPDELARRRNESNPDNGRAGWWRVEGNDRGAIVRASSAPEAVAKAAAAGRVASWELPEATFVGEELPEVF
jgi:hypothetical protein